MTAEGRPARRKKRRKRSPKQCAAELAIVLRQEKACELRLEGLSLEAIGKRLGVSIGTVHSDIEAVLERSRDAATDAIEKQKRLSLRRLDRAVQAIWAKVKRGDTDAIRELRGIEQRRAKIEGFDAADKHEISGPGGRSIPIDARVAMVNKLNALGERLGGSEPGGTPGAGPDPSE